MFSVGEDPGVRRQAGLEALAPFSAYVTGWFDDDPHTWTSALYDDGREAVISWSDDWEGCSG
jgi:hypothetical protein